MGWFILAIVCFVAICLACFAIYRWGRRTLTRAIKFCEAELDAYQAKLDEKDRKERQERLARDPFPRPGGPATPAKPR